MQSSLGGCSGGCGQGFDEGVEHGVLLVKKRGGFLKVLVPRRGWKFEGGKVYSSTPTNSWSSANITNHLWLVEDQEHNKGEAATASRENIN